MSTTQAPPDVDPSERSRGSWWSRQTTTTRVLVISTPVLVLVLAAALFTRSPVAPPAVSGGATSQAANACLGGDRDLDSAVQYAQANAPLTGKGAVEFLATAFRWLNNSSAAKSPQRPSIVAALVAPEASEVVRSGFAFTDFKADVVTSYVGGVYRIDGATSQAATVTLMGSFEGTTPERGKQSGTIFNTWELVAVGGVWKIQARSDRPVDPTQLRATGTQFQGSC